MRFLVAPDLEIEALRQRVDDRDADAVQTARDLVGAVLELAAGVQDRQRDFGRRLAALVHVGRNAAAVVDDADRVVEMNRDVDFGAVAGERFVDRVVDDLVNQVMQTGRPRGADVHRRALANRFKAFEDLDAFGAVVGVAVARVPVRAAETGLIFWLIRLGHLLDLRVACDASVQTRIGMMT